MLYSIVIFEDQRVSENWNLENSVSIVSLFWISACLLSACIATREEVGATISQKQQMLAVSANIDVPKSRLLKYSS